jgi:hypothetical protein
MCNADLVSQARLGAMRQSSEDDAVPAYLGILRRVLCALPVPLVLCVVASQRRGGFGVMGGFARLFWLNGIKRQEQRHVIAAACNVSGLSRRVRLFT